MAEQIEILVVDDDKEIANLVEIYLSSTGYIIYKAYNASGWIGTIAEA